MSQSIDLLHESARSPHPPTPSPKGGEGEPEIGSDGDFVVDFQVPLPTWERDLELIHKEKLKPTWQL
jgi:hypothetical protein